MELTSAAGVKGAQNFRTPLLVWIAGQRAILLATASLFSAGYATVGLPLLFAGLVVEGVATGRVPWWRSRLDIPLLAFVVIFLISGVLSSYIFTAVGSALLMALTIYVAFGPLYQYLQRDKKFLTPFLSAWVAGGAVSALWACYNHWLTKLPAFMPAIGPTAVGTTLQIALVLNVGLFATATTAWRYLVAAGMPILMLGLALTYSRGAWGGAAIALGLFFLLVELRSAWRAFLLLILIGLAGAAFVAVAHPAINPVIIKRMEAPFSLEGEHWRVYLAESALAIFKDHPVIGTGLNTFALVYPRYRLPGDPNPLPVPFAHNIFLNTAAEGGVLSLAAFTAIIVWTAVAGWQWYATSSVLTETILSASILSALLGVMVQQLFDGTILSVNLGAGLWFLIAILAAFGPSLAPRAVGSDSNPGATSTYRVPLGTTQ